MAPKNPERIRRAIGELDRRIARVELQVGTATRAASELERAGLFDAGSTEELVFELWQMVERLKALRDGWAELHANLSGEPVPRREQEALH